MLFHQLRSGLKILNPTIMTDYHHYTIGSILTMVLSTTSYAITVVTI